MGEPEGASGLKEGRPTSDPEAARAAGRAAGIAFWATVGVLALGTLALVAIAALRSPEGAAPRGWGTQAPAEAVLPQTLVERLAAEAAEVAREETEALIDAQLAAAFAPVEAAVAEYADFHYSVRGEYLELWTAATGRFEEELEARLYEGFDARLEIVAAALDTAFGESFRRELHARLEGEAPGGALAEARDLALGNAVERLVFKPIPATAAALGGTAGAVSSAIALKVLGKATFKAGGKAAGKASGVLTGAGTGAAIGSIGGPVGAAVGGVVGGVAAWFAVDAVVVEVDEHFNREAFEAELRALVAEHRVEVRDAFRAAVADKATEVSGRTILEERAAGGQERARGE